MEPGAKAPRPAAAGQGRAVVTGAGAYLRPQSLAWKRSVVTGRLLLCSLKE